MVTGYEIDFSAPMNPATTGNSGNYMVQKAVTKRVKRKLVVTYQSVFAPITFNPSSNSVTLAVAGKVFSKGGRITVIASPPAGISSTLGVFLDGSNQGVAGDNAVFIISPKGTGISRG